MKRVRWSVVLFGLLLPVPGVAGSADERLPITIAADTLEVSRKSRLAVYRGNVVANDRARGVSILADRIEFYFDERMETVQRAVAAGNVRLAYGERRGAGERAEYYPAESRAVLVGHPRIWQDNDVVSGCKITLLLREDRSQIDGCEGERVNAVLYPRRGEGTPAETPRR